ncbi:MAG TPA: hypothetical protein VND95_11700 [Stellaceae bacterium]|nr:hypothetical protein [Stellaceae bacterium]
MAQSQVTVDYDRGAQRDRPGDLAAGRAGAPGVAHIEAAHDAAATAIEIG